MWAGVVLLAILFVQFWNSGRPLVYDSAVARWVASPPPHPAWPGAYDAAEARQMVTWFLPAWGLALAIRSGAMSGASLRDLLVFIALNSAVLSVFGIAMRVTGMTDMYGTTPLPNRFFASFGYENHAASFFMLTSMVSAGLLFDEMAAESGQYRRRWVMLFAAAVGLNLVGVVLSFSRAGILLASGTVVTAMVYAVVWSRWRLLPAERVKLLATMVGLAALGWFSADLIGGPELSRELRSVTGPVVTSPVPDAPRSGIPVLLDRVHLVRSAVLMWRSSPWFGIGGAGFRHEYADHVPREYKYYIAQSGKANVHNDGIQFLAEFGVIGVGAMAVAVGAMAVPIARRRLRYLPLVFLSLVGLVGVMLHSVVDLPFRSPAVLFTWVSVLAVLSVLAGNAGPRGGRSRGGVSGRGDRESVQAVR